MCFIIVIVVVTCHVYVACNYYNNNMTVAVPPSIRILPYFEADYG